jgi:photosystem II stability/assembly factor-like uncharacterized protein
MQLKSNKELFGRCAFIDPLVGWVLGSKGEVYRTVNGGVNWQRHSISSTMNDLQAFFFIDRESGWLSETPRGRIYETEDGGQKWHPQRMPIPELTIRSLHFISKQEGWAAGLWENAKDEQYSSGSVVIHTVDGGQTWERLFSCKAESRFDVINFADRSHGWLVSPTGAYRSDDGGRSWKLVLRSQEGLLSENSRNCE